MKSSEDIEELLERLGNAWSSGDSIVTSVMREIEPTPTHVATPSRTRLLRNSLIGTCTAAAVGVLAWLVLFFTFTPAVTLAQVRAAIAAQKWMHVKYDNGREFWTTLDGAQQYNKSREGFVTYHDRPKNFRLSYWPMFGFISESTAYVPGGKVRPWKPKTLAEIVGFSMEMPEGEASAKQKQMTAYTERHNVTVEGRQMVRFDQYREDALGQYLLEKQIWVDPQTRLPVRVRAWLQLGERKEPDQKYSTGEYTFSEHGPHNIYDLGVPRDAPVVRDQAKPPRDVAKLIDLAKQARDRFPTHYRLIVWSNDDPWSNIYVIYQDGAPVRKDGFSDWRGVRARQAYYFNLQKDHPAYHLPLPATAEQVLAWTKTQVPVGINISDGTRSFSMEGSLPPSFQRSGSNVPQPRLEVRRVFSSILMNTQFWPTSYQWPIVNHMGPFTLLTEGDEDVPGTIAIRQEAGSERRDFYLDPNRDYICIHQVWCEKTAGKWAKEREYTLLDLKRLPEGQWYATKEHLETFGSPERKTVGNALTWNLDLRILAKDEFPPDTFNGDKLLEEAKREGAIIEGN